MEIGACGASVLQASFLQYLSPASLPIFFPLHCTLGWPKRLIQSPSSNRAPSSRRMKIFAHRMMPGTIYAISSTTPPWSSIGDVTRPAPDPSCSSTFPADGSRTIWSGVHGSRWVSSKPWSKAGVADDEGKKSRPRSLTKTPNEISRRLKYVEGEPGSLQTTQVLDAMRYS